MLAEKKVKRILKVKKITMTDDAEYTCKVAKKTTTATCTVKRMFMIFLRVKFMSYCCY